MVCPDMLSNLHDAGRASMGFQSCNNPVLKVFSLCHQLFLFLIYSLAPELSRAARRVGLNELLAITSTRFTRLFDYIR